MALSPGVTAVRSSSRSRPVSGLSRLYYFLGLLLLISAGRLGGQQPPGANPGPSNGRIQVLLHKLDEANESGDFRQGEALCQEIIRERPSSALGYIRLGLVYKREQDLQKALSTFQSATRVDPGSFEAHYELGEAYLGAGQPDKAIGSLSQAIRLEPRSSQGHRLLAQALKEGGKTGSAIQEFLRSVELDPSNPAGYYDLGQTCLQRAVSIADKVVAESKTSPYSRRIFAENFIGHGSFGEAETQYRLALTAEPDALDLHLGLGELCLRENKLKEAGKEFAQAVQIAPTSLVANYDLAEADFLRRDLQSALSSLERIATSNPGFLPSNPNFLEFVTAELVWKEECPRISSLASSGQPDPAVSFLEEMCRRALHPKQVLQPISAPETQNSARPPARISPAPASEDQSSFEPCSAGLCGICEERPRAALAKPGTEFEARLKLGQCAYDVRDYASAYRHFAAARESNPQSVGALYWEQEALRQLAQTSFERIQQLAPDSYLLHLLNAQTWDKLNQPARAEQEYRAAIARSSDIAYLHILLGHLFWFWERYDEALLELQEALRLDPADPVANYLIGDIWVQKHEAENALPYLDKALRLRPGFLNAEASLGRALSQLGKYQEAVSELLKVAPADADGSIHFQLFQLYQKLGQEDKAKEALELFKRIRARQLPESASGDALGLPR